MFRLIRFSFVVLFIWLIAACNAGPIKNSSTLTPTPIVSAEPIGPTAAPTSTPSPNRPITLTLWLPPSFMPGDQSPAQKILAQQIQTIDPKVNIVTKKEHGAGGLLDLLRTASPVAPSILPDIIALDSVDLATAARSGLLQPLDDLIGSDSAIDLYPFARDLGSIDGQLYGLIYSADLEQFIFNSKTVKTQPAKWSDITQPYIFALHDDVHSVSDAVLSQYLSAGGTFLNADHQPALDQAALVNLLELYQQAQQAKVLTNAALDLNNVSDAWTLFRKSNAVLVNVSASIYLSEAQALPALQFAALPSIDLAAPPIARGWALAIVTREPRRQIAAMKFIQALLAPENNGAWTQAAHVLPGRISALQHWDQTNPYTSFVAGQLQQAIAAPPPTIMNVIGPALRTAIDDVLSNRASPSDAAATAVDTVNQSK